jgi:ABC-type iron transport system FetAB ATPase subunit
MNKVCGMLLACVVIAGIALGQTGPNQRTVTVAFNGSTNIVQKAVGSLPAPTSVVVTFPAGMFTNTLSIDLVRSNVTHKLVQYTYFGSTVSWYAPNNIYMVKGDVLTISNSATNAAVLMYNETF